MTNMDNKKQKQNRRHNRVRAKIQGTPERPRLSLSRSNKHMFLQLIDDIKGNTIASAGDFNDKKGAKKEAKVDSAKNLGKEIAKLAKEKKISSVVFDRGGHKYHGRVKAAAESAREEGLQF